ncbi:uncharacterized protein STEHIDRAFT_156293 [Stereum hirsutum FP-91666 SS1]|uniref:uncharacterized protein n=1 Tax=Stereum hirsutum (strain FP-91666) TaxID=721885 RepID=UPI000440C23A|nr:uncharacterized protein STEHIDRAFT_156293 [Stereum hirsutum FP-91666 SS1]EIM87311.1 hypothetical protein STEHIDRAFT_156293 [Stereum hirsutum FP-91666 SS1]
MAPTITVRLARGLWTHPTKLGIALRTMGECADWAERVFAGTNADVDSYICRSGYHISKKDRRKRRDRRKRQAVKPHLTVKLTVNGRMYIGKPSHTPSGLRDSDPPSRLTKERYFLLLKLRRRVSMSTVVVVFSSYV